MQLTQDSSQGDYQIKKYEPGQITINEETYFKSLIIGLKHLDPNWPPQSLAKLTTSDLSAILNLQPEVVILGTGKHFKVPNQEVITYFHEKKIGFEFMDTGAACRTFVALSSEGRNVVAALLIE